MRVVFERNVVGHTETMLIYLEEDNGDVVDVIDSIGVSAQQVTVSGDMCWFGRPFFEAIKDSLTRGA